MSDGADETGMPEFAWQQFHDVAARLIERGDEASLRCAVSRDYYAVFHRAKAVLTKIDPFYAPARGVGSHEDVWNTLGERLKGKSGMLAREGHTLLKQRKKADYQHPIADWPGIAHRAHELASHALSLADELDAR